MANNIVFNLSVNGTDKAVGDLTTLEEKIGSVAESFNGIDGSNVSDTVTGIEEIGTATDSTVSSVENLGTAFSDTSSTSTESLAEIESSMNSLKENTDTTSENIKSFGYNLDKASSGAEKGIRALSGVFRALGVDTQVLDGIQDGLQAVGNLLKSQEKLSKVAFDTAPIKEQLKTVGELANAQKVSETAQKATATATVANTTATVAQTTATGAATVATRALSIALNALPWIAVAGGIATAIGALVNFKKANEESRGAFKDNTDALKSFFEFDDSKLVNGLKAINDSSKKRIDILENEKRLLEANGATLNEIERKDKQIIFEKQRALKDEITFIKAKDDANKKSIASNISEINRLTEEIKRAQYEIDNQLKSDEDKKAKLDYIESKTKAIAIIEENLTKAKDEQNKIADLINEKSNELSVSRQFDLALLKAINDEERARIELLRQQRLEELNKSINEIRDNLEDLNSDILTFLNDANEEYGDLEINLKLNSDDFETEIEGLLLQLEDSFEDISNSTAQNIKDNFDALNASYQQQIQNINELEREIEDILGKSDNNTNFYDELNKEADDYKKKIDELNAKIEEQEQRLKSLDKNSDAYKNISKNIEDSKKKSVEFNNTLKDLNLVLEEFKNNTYKLVSNNAESSFLNDLVESSNRLNKQLVETQSKLTELNKRRAELFLQRSQPPKADPVLQLPELMKINEATEEAETKIKSLKNQLDLLDKEFEKIRTSKGITKTQFDDLLKTIGKLQETAKQADITKQAIDELYNSVPAEILEIGVTTDEEKNNLIFKGLKDKIDAIRKAGGQIKLAVDAEIGDFGDQILNELEKKFNEASKEQKITLPFNTEFKNESLNKVNEEVNKVQSVLDKAFTDALIQIELDPQFKNNPEAKQKAINELTKTFDSLKTVVNEKGEKLTKDINNFFSEKQQQIINNILSITKTAVDLYSSLLDFDNARLENLQDQIEYEGQLRDEYYQNELEKLDEYLSEKEQLIAESESRIDEIENQLENARGKRAEFLLKRLLAEQSTLQNLQAEKRKLAKDEEKLKLQQEKEEEARKKRLNALAEKQFENTKAIQIAQAIINTAGAVLQALNYPPGPPATIPMSIATGAIGAVQIAKIASQKFVPIYKDGGELVGASHKEGGIKGTGKFAGIEVEGGEFIINKKATVLNYEVADKLNKEGKYKKFALIERKFEDGGLLTTTTDIPKFQNVDSTLYQQPVLNSDKTESMLKELNVKVQIDDKLIEQAIIRGMQNVTIETSLVDVQTGLNNITRIREESKI